MSKTAACFRWALLLCVSVSLHVSGAHGHEVPEGNKMIVITTAAYKDAVAPLVEWKNRKGIKTTLYVYPDQTGGTGHTVLKNFIQTTYAGDAFSYILIVGNENDVPVFLFAGGMSDPSYTLLKGDDIYPDAFIGRFSVESVQQVATMVNKVIRYEKYPDPQGEWYNKAAGLASVEGSPADSTYMNIFRDSLLSGTYDHVDKIYQGHENTTMKIAGAVNSGRSWIMYIGHGSASCWGSPLFYNADVRLLNNYDKLPVVISSGAYNGDIEVSAECFAETWTRLGSPDSAKGAIAFLGFGAHSWPAYLFCSHSIPAMISCLIHQSYFSIGGIINNGQIRALEKYPEWADAFKIWNLFGDPSLMIYTNTPAMLHVAHPHRIGLGTQTISVSGEESTSVCLYGKGQGIHEVKLIINSSAVFTVNVTKTDSIFVTGIKYNRMPYLGGIHVDSSTAVSYTVNGTLEAEKLRALPNPVIKDREYVTFFFDIPHGVRGRLRIVDVRGVEIYRSSVLTGNAKSVQWQLKTMQGNTPANGTYLVVLILTDCHGRQRMIRTVLCLSS